MIKYDCHIENLGAVFMLIMLCDDCEKDRILLRKYLSEYCKEQHICCDIKEACSGEDFIQMKELSDVDVVFMDIYMGHLNGIETSRQLVERGFSGCFVYTTSSTEHVFESFAFNVLDYLVKPFSYDRLHKSMDKLISARADSLLTVSVIVNGTQKQIPRNKIVSIETGHNHNTLIHLQNSTIICQTLLSDLEQQLSGCRSFLKCHRSYIINLNEVSGVENATVYMKNNTTAMLVQRNAAELKKQINEYLWKNMMED